MKYALSQPPVDRCPFLGRRLRRILALGLACWWLGTLPVAAQWLYPPHAMVEGRTLQEWSAEWWKWIMALPVDQNPGLDDTGAKALNGQSGRVVFLVSTFTSSTASRSITVADGSYLLIPTLNLVNNSLGENPWGTLTEELLDAGTEFSSQTISVDASIDGVALTNSTYTTGWPVTNLLAHREVAPEFRLWLPPTNNIFQLFGVDLAGFLDPCYADGFWFMFAPLPVGRHTIHINSIAGPPSNFTQELSYQVAVKLRLGPVLAALVKRLVESGLASQQVQPLLVSLQAAQASSDAGKQGAAANQLEAFQNKVRAQVAPRNAALAAELIQAAQRMVDVLNANLALP